jgi:hypothetical protein
MMEQPPSPRGNGYVVSRNLNSPHGAAELSYLIGLYCLVSVTLNTFDVPIPET